MRHRPALLLCAALVVPACGGDDDPDRSRPAASVSTAGTETAPPAPDPGAAAGLAPAERAEIREVVTAAATNREPCEHLTERYLEEFVLEGVTSDDPAAACRQAEQGQPELRDSQVEIATVRGSGDEAEVAFSLGGLEQRATLVRSGGRWLIDRFEV